MMFRTHAGESLRSRGIYVPDELYVIRQVGVWLSRLLNAGIHVDEELLDVCRWVLGEDIYTLNDDILHWVDERENVKSKEAGGNFTGGLTVQNYLDFIKHKAKSWPGDVENILDSCPKELNSLLNERIRRKLDVFLDNGGKLDNDFFQAEKRLAPLFHLSESELKLCTFMYIVSCYNEATDYFQRHLKVTTSSSQSLIAIILNITPYDLNNAVQGKLKKLELVENEAELQISESMISLYREAQKADDIVHEFSPSRQPALDLHEYPVDPSLTKLVVSQLAIHDATPTHVLLYGPPGTGKTSYARSLGRALQQDVFFVPFDRGGVKGHFSRKTALAITTNITDGGKSGLMVMDEADSMLNTMRSFSLTGSQSERGWLNDLLEEPGMRVVWIVNDVSEIDHSVLDRFSCFVRFPSLRADGRKKVWERVARECKVKRFLSEQHLQGLASEHVVSARGISLALRQARKMSQKQGAAFRNTLEVMLNAQREVMRGPEKMSRPSRKKPLFVKEALNLDCSLESVLRRMRAMVSFRSSGGDLNGAGAMLFYGPPGTGKTALAKYLAYELGKSASTYKASDILDSYVGGTEKSLAGIFSKESEGDNILVLDEVDTFVFSREDAHRSWEFSLVNEFLVQLESYQGIIVCTTNRYESLSSAVYRRFGSKIQFSYSNDEGKIALYKELLAPLSHKKASSVVFDQVKSISRLTPGDYASVHNSFKFSSQEIVRHEDLVDSLAKVARDKRDVFTSNSIGFL